MTPDQIKDARHQLGLSMDQMAAMLGYVGIHRRQQMDDLETGKKPLRAAQQRLLEAYLGGYRPADWAGPAGANTGACQGLVPAFELFNDGHAIRFKPCGVISYHPKDAEHRYCARCGRFVPEVMQDFPGSDNA